MIARICFYFLWNNLESFSEKTSFTDVINFHLRSIILFNRIIVGKNKISFNKHVYIIMYEILNNINVYMYINELFNYFGRT